MESSDKESNKKFIELMDENINILSDSISEIMIVIHLLRSRGVYYDSMFHESIRSQMNVMAFFYCRRDPKLFDDSSLLHQKIIYRINKRVKQRLNGQLIEISLIEK